MQNASELIEAAYDQYADAIFRHCYLRLNNREVAKELMQDTFLKTFQYVGKGKDVENVRALLYRIANNLIIDYVRRSKETSLDALQEAGFDPTGSDDRQLAGRLDDQRVAETLHKLDKDTRELIVMRFISDMKPREIAEVLGISPNVASVRIHRALQDLKSLLKQP